MATPERRDGPTDIEFERVIRRYDLAKLVVAPAAWILSLALPIWAAEPVAKALAGKDTNLTFTFSITIVVSLALAGGMGALLLRQRGQRKELERLRVRCEELENELAEQAA